MQRGKNHCFLRQPNASQKCNQIMSLFVTLTCSKYANRYIPYWKILFLSSLFWNTAVLTALSKRYVEWLIGLSVSVVSSSQGDAIKLKKLTVSGGRDDSCLLTMTIYTVNHTKT